MDEPSFYGFPTYGEAGPKAAQDSAASRSIPTSGHSSATRRRSRASRRSWRTTCRAALGPPIYTKTCLYTLTPDRDFVVDRLPDQPRCRGRTGRGPRLQVRVGHRPDPGRAEHRRSDAVGTRARVVPDRSADPARDRSADLLDDLTDRRAHGRTGQHLHGNHRCAHRTASPGEEGPPWRRTSDAIDPARPDDSDADGVRSCGDPDPSSCRDDDGRRSDDPARRDDPGSRLAQSVRDAAAQSATRSSPSTTTCSSAIGRTTSRSRASPSHGPSRPTALSWTFKIRAGMKWSDGQPATAEDARWSYQYILERSRPGRARRLRLPRHRTSRTRRHRR